MLRTVEARVSMDVFADAKVVLESSEAVESLGCGRSTANIGRNAASVDTVAASLGGI